MSMSRELISISIMRLGGASASSPISALSIRFWKIHFSEAIDKPTVVLAT